MVSKFNMNEILEMCHVCTITIFAGGPDENPRFEKNLFMGAKTFKVFMNI